MTITPSTELNDEIACHADGLICRLLDAVSSLDDTNTEEGRSVALANVRESVLLARKVQVASNNLSFTMCAAGREPAPAPAKAPTTKSEMENRLANGLDLLREIYPHLVGALISIVDARESEEGDDLAMKNVHREIYRAMELLRCVDTTLASGDRDHSGDDPIVLEAVR